jgi:hypothetical protein
LRKRGRLFAGRSFRQPADQQKGMQRGNTRIIDAFAKSALTIFA